MENIFMTTAGIIRRLSIRYGKGELIDVAPGCTPPYWRAVLQQINRHKDNEVQIKVDYWLDKRGHPHPALTNFSTPGFEYTPKDGDLLFAAVIPVLRPYFWPDDPINPTELMMESLRFQLDIHNGTEKPDLTTQTRVRLHLATAQLELVG